MADKKQNQSTKDKRNAKGGGSVRQRPDGRWEARCTIGGKTRSFYADKQADALKLMRDAQKAVDDQTYVEPSKLTVEQWGKIWLEEYEKPSVKEVTYVNNRGYLLNHIFPTLGKIKLTVLSTPQIQAFYNKLQNKGTLSAQTIKDIHSTLCHMLCQAKKLKYIKFNPTDDCVLPKITKREIIPLSEDDMANFLSEIKKGEPLKNLFIVTLFTGMRMGEVTGLPWDCINFRDNTITIKQQLCRSRLSGGEYYIGTPKNGKPRTITAAPFVFDILKAVRQEQINNRFIMGEAWNNEWNLVFTDPEGKCYPHQNVWKHFKGIAKKIGRPDARFHDLRHTYAVTALQEGIDVKTIQNNLGHATAAFTLDVYSHVSEKMKKESAKKMQMFYEKINV